MAANGFRVERPHPNLGGSRGYDPQYRAVQIAKLQDGEPLDCDRSSVYRWINDIRRKEQKGGPEATKRVSGHFLLLLAYIRHRFPKLRTFEVVAEIATHTGVVFEESAILNAENEGR